MDGGRPTTGFQVLRRRLLFPSLVSFPPTLKWRGFLMGRLLGPSRGVLARIPLALPPFPPSREDPNPKTKKRSLTDARRDRSEFWIAAVWRETGRGRRSEGGGGERRCFWIPIRCGPLLPSFLLFRLLGCGLLRNMDEAFTRVTAYICHRF